MEEVAATSKSRVSTLTSVKRRLILDRIVLHNFKSYAGEVTVGPFHQHFSVIVGPNGSGKSNIIDAMLFVFGRRAAQLRQKKIVDLIHTSDNHKPKWAKVTVHMAYILNQATESSSKACLSQEPAFWVSRDVHCDGSSKYQLDGKTVTHSEMIAFLKDQQIDLEHNRFLILQGEVEQMAMMPPKGKKEGEIGFLEILEDLIGSNVYIEKIAATQVQLEEAKKEEAEWIRKHNLAQNEIGALTEPCMKAFQVVKHQKKLLVAKAKLHAKMKSEYNEKCVGIQSKLEAKESQLRELQQAKEEILEQLKELETQMRTDETKLKEAEKIMGNLRQEMESCNIEDGKLRESIKLLKKQINSREQHVIALEKEAAQLGEDAENTLLEAKKCKAELPTLEARLAQTSIALEQLSHSLEAEYQKAAADKLKHSKLVEEASSAYQDIKNRRIEVESQVEVLQRTLNSAADRVQQLRAKIGARKSDLAKAEIGIKKEEENIAVAGAEYTSAQKLVQDHIAERTKLQNELEAIISEQSKQVEGKSGVTAMVRMYHELSKAMEHNGRLAGMGSFLLDRGKLDIARYGVALSVGGCGGELVICPDETAATKVIDYVKLKQLGRIECAVLPKMQARWLKEYLAWKAKVERNEYPAGSIPFISLIEDADEDTMLMYYTRFRDTLLVEGSLEDAKRIHRDGDKRWRVVTMRGELIEKFGTMTGGKATNYLEQRRHQQKSTDENQLRNLRQRRQAVEAKLSTMQHSWADKVRNLERLKEQSKRIEQNLEYEKDKVKHMKMELGHFEEILKEMEQEAKISVNDTQIQDLKEKNKELEKLRKTEAEAQMEYERRKTTAKRIEEKIGAIGGKEKQRLEETKAALTASVGSSRNVINNADCEAAEKVKKAEIIINSKIPNTKHEIQRIEVEIGEKENKILALEDKARPLLLDYEKTEVLLTELKKVLRKTKKEKDDKEASFRDQSNAMLPIQNEVADLEAGLSRCKKALAEEDAVIQSLRSDYDELPVFDPQLLEALQQHDKKEGEEEAPVKVEAMVKREVVTDSDDDESEIVADTLANADKTSNPNGVVDHPRQSQETMRDLAQDAKYLFPDSFNVEDTPLSEFQLNVHRCEETLTKYTKGGDLQDLTVLTHFMEKSRAAKSIDKERQIRTQRVNELVEIAENFAQQRANLFSSGFTQISIKLKELYQMLTLGGDAELEYRDPSDPFRGGIEFSVRPPGKSWRIIQNLSGGEKTLSSLALIFALHHYKPTPIYFLDEIDAALDPQNVVIIASYVAEEYRTGGAQFVVISLRNQFFERADRLVGVCKVKDRTQTCTIDPEALAAPDPQPMDKKRRYSDTVAAPIATSPATTVVYF